MNIDYSKLSSIISLFVGIAILSATYFQWWNITYDGDLKTRKWVKFMLGIFILLLLTSLAFVIYSD